MNKLLKPIIYYSLFNHWLNKQEVKTYCHESNEADFKNIFNEAVSQNILISEGGYFTLNLEPSTKNKRVFEENKALEILPIALKKINRIYKNFPFIAGIGISGSLSKGYFDKESDLDFFIITNHKRLWLCRFILTFYKKIFLLNSRKYFCMNYFISEKHLLIEEQNIFTATEIKTLIACEGAVMKEFYNTNQWAKDYYPNFIKDFDNLKQTKKTTITTFIERILNNKTGDFIEKLCFKFTFNIWKKKYKSKLSQADFEVAFKSNEKVSKHHPQNFQKQVILKYNKQVDRLNEKFKLKIPHENA